MTNSYQELLIKQKSNSMNRFLGIGMIVLSILSVISAVVLFRWYFLIGAVLCAILSYVLYFRRKTVEFAYTYLDKELRVDRIYNQTRRKQIDVLDMNKAEIVAPLNSNHLDNYKNRQTADSNYSTGEEDTDELKTYVMYYEGKRRIFFSFSEDMIQAIRTGIPSKTKLQ